jgi:hypothetical protein
MRGEELRREAKKADKALGAELDRLQLTDERFKRVLERALALETEVDRRKNK